MHAENTTTDHNRTIRLTNILGTHLDELEITVNYARGDGGNTLRKAITLDNDVIPAIIAAINGSAMKEKRCEL